MASNNKDKSAAGWQVVSAISVGATGGADDVFTWTHNRGVLAAALYLVDSTNKAKVLDADITVTQTDVNTIVVDNATGGALVADLIILWKIPSRNEVRPTTGTALLATGEAVAS